MKPILYPLIVAFALPLAGCAAFDRPPDALENVADALHTPDIDAAIKAAKPGEPRQEARSAPRS